MDEEYRKIIERLQDFTEATSDDDDDVKEPVVVIGPGVSRYQKRSANLRERDSSQVPDDDFAEPDDDVTIDLRRDRTEGGNGDSIYQPDSAGRPRHDDDA